MKKKDQGTISETLEAEAVRAINEQCKANQREVYITADFLQKEFPDVDPNHLITFLVGRNLIEYRSSGLESGKNYIRLNKCITYFEDKARQEKEKRSDRAHDWLIAVFSALAGALLSKPLWGTLENIWKMVSPR